MTLACTASEPLLAPRPSCPCRRGALLHACCAHFGTRHATSPTCSGTLASTGCTTSSRATSATTLWRPRMWPRQRRWWRSGSPALNALMKRPRSWVRLLLAGVEARCGWAGTEVLEEPCFEWMDEEAQKLAGCVCVRMWQDGGWFHRCLPTGLPEPSSQALLPRMPAAQAPLPPPSPPHAQAWSGARRAGGA